MIEASRGSPVRRLRHAAGAVLVVLALLQVVPGPVGAQTTQTQRELDQARRELEELEKGLERAKARVEQVRAAITSLNNQISQLTVHIEALRSAKAAAEEAIERSRNKALELQGTLNARARDVYMRGPAGVVELLLDADSLNDLADRFNFLDALTRKDAGLAEGLEVQRQELTDLRRSLTEYEVDLDQQLASLEGKDRQLEAKWEREATLKADYQERVDEAREIVERLTEKAKREFEAQFGIVGSGTVGPPPSADGPFYFCPVDPPRSYIDDFGFPRVGHTHQGNDIFAPAGTPIRAPFAGRAEESFNGLGGTSVHVYADANGDYVYNAHLSKHVGVDGQHVEPGDIIGLVGNTGNAASTPPHDHFEYHPGGGSAVSPYVYLNEVCGVGGQGF
ncbi:MAG TPA: peptidoglycan DD-metalloendopeptidase family protein [Actinomycetota bacterium]|jgi:murein DD-endopeptidase MepM/ murein hydrolase activator NlpD|nr:peptidoglycan DD-metalloendopeptidase family protein [Actinomycetota bacterium]